MTTRLAERIAEQLNDCSPEDIRVESYDLRREPELGGVLDEDTVAVIGMPVYVGKLPLPALYAIRQIAALGAMTVAAVSYGGRSYGNALYELQHSAEEQGFRVIGAGAFLISYQAMRGSQRSAAPAMDTAALAEFGKAACAKIQRLGGCEIEGLRIKPMPVEAPGRMPVHLMSRISPSAAALAQELIERLSFRRRRSEWYL